jgi:hypothetical protein
MIGRRHLLLVSIISDTDCNANFECMPNFLPVLFIVLTKREASATHYITIMESAALDRFPATRALEASFTKKRRLSRTESSTSDVSDSGHRSQKEASSSYDMNDLFHQASSVLDEYALGFPTIEWCSDDEDDSRPVAKKRKTNNITGTSKNRQLRCEDVPFLLRCKSLTSNLEALGSSNSSLCSES